MLLPRPTGDYLLFAAGKAAEGGEAAGAPSCPSYPPASVPHDSGTGTVLSSIAREGHGAWSSARAAPPGWGRARARTRRRCPHDSGAGTAGLLITRGGDGDTRHPCRHEWRFIRVPGCGRGAGTLPASVRARRRSGHDCPRRSQGDPAGDGTGRRHAPDIGAGTDSGHRHGARLDRPRRGQRSVQRQGDPAGCAGGGGHAPRRGWHSVQRQGDPPPGARTGVGRSPMGMAICPAPAPPRRERWARSRHDSGAGTVLGSVAPGQHATRQIGSSGQRQRARPREGAWRPFPPP
jgi:hypothetical protein